MRRITSVVSSSVVLGIFSSLVACSSSDSDSDVAEEAGSGAESPGSAWGNSEVSGEANSQAAGGETTSETETLPMPTLVVGEEQPGEQVAEVEEEPPPTLLGDVVLSTPSQAFEAPLTVALSTELQDVEIRYTTDGSVPTATSSLYNGTAFEFEQTVQLRTQAFVEGAAAGAPSSALYVARDFDIESDLPVIVIDGYEQGKPEDRDNFSDIAFLVFEPGESPATLSVLPKLATRAGYHVRGQSSASFDKAPYRIELWDNESDDADYELLGMPAEADWALIGPFADRSLIRHAFAYSLGADMGMTAPRYAFAEVYLNAEGDTLQAADYEGVYMVVETIKNQKNRLDLKQLREEDVSSLDISGGYIFKFDWAASEEPTLSCSGSEPLSGAGFGFGGGNQNQGGTCWTDLEVVDPTPLNSEQEGYLTDYVQTFHDSLHTQSLSEYETFIDIASFVDQFIINELTRDIDAYTRSAFYHKERDQPLRAGPLWDYNLTLGVGFGANREVTGWQWEEREVASDWFRILGADSEFMALVALRWQELRQGLLSEERLLERVDALSAPLARAADRDLERWPVPEVSQGIFQIPDAPSWDGQIDVLKEWMTDRIAWLDSQI